MRVYGLKALRLWARWLRSRLAPCAIILGYHRIEHSPSDPFSLSVSPANFAEQLAFICKHARPVSLRKLIDCLKAGKVPARAVVITFDDGYADNLHVAKPLLERYEVPATVFVATGYLGGQFWWDELAAIVLNAKPLPQRLRLSINGNAYEWKPERGLRDGETARRRRLLGWLQQVFQQLPRGDRPEAMEQLRVLTGVTTAARSAAMVLSRDELRRLARGSLVEIGAHTVSHPMLARLPLVEQTSEMLQSKMVLEELLDQPITSFSYPHGFLSQATVAAVQEAGYSCACTSLNDVVRGGSDCFQLPRFWAGDSDGSSFGRWLRPWLSGTRDDRGRLSS